MSNHARRPKLAPSFAAPPPQLEEAPEPTPEPLDYFANAWRFFGLDDDGTLVAPFVDRYWPSSVDDRAWRTETKNAKCIAADHDAPAENCSCGITGVKSWPAFLAAVTSASFLDSPVSVLEECPVIARVTLAGRALPSPEENDPPGTFRAEQATVNSLHLGPSISREVAQVVADRYRRARCFRYDADAWPTGVDGPDTERVWPTPTSDNVDGFLDAVRAAGFGILRRKERDKHALKLGNDAVQALRDGASPHDLASVLFDSPAKPTFAQAETLVLAAAEHLSPGLAVAAHGFQHARPVKQLEALVRPAQQIASRFAAGPQ